MERIQPHIIKAKLYASGRVEWVNADEEGNVQLHVHQKARQYLQVELADFVLVETDGECLFVAFDKGEDHVNPSAMANENSVYKIAIPSLVHNNPGVWSVQFFIETNEMVVPSHTAEFTEYSSIVDDGIEMVDEARLSQMYEAVLTAQKEATTARDEVLEQLQNTADGLLVEDTEFVGEVENGYEYKLTLRNGSTVNVVAPHGKINTEWWI
jgi:hypothetical protein